MRLAMQQGIVNHGHVRSQFSCELYALTATGILGRLTVAESVARAEHKPLRLYGCTDNEGELKIVLDGRFDTPRGSAYVVVH
jgi:hypothetical protein